MPIPGCKTAGNGVLYRKFYPTKGIIMRILLCSCLLLFTLAASAADGKVVRYADFGAKGDGKTNDAASIIKAHKYANEHGLPVRADDDATYFIGEAEEFAPIMTDTDWGKAHFIIDDRGELKKFKQPIFRILSNLPKFEIKDLPPLKRGQTSVGRKFPGRAVLIAFDEQTRRFIRYGANANQGSFQVDSILVDKEGNIDPETPVNWDFKAITRLDVYPVDEKPLTVRGGIFKTFTNAREGRHSYFARNISIRRSNTVLENIRHEVVEPGGLDSWPYTGFISVNDCAEVTIRNCEVSGRKVYGWLPAGQKTGKRRTTGTYDVSCMRALKIKFIGLRQINDICDGELWGVMGSNFCKSITLEKCRISRFDAHQGVTNAVVRDCELGYQGINAIGFGTFRIENTVKRAMCFVNFRNDYGSTWHGKFIIRNCKFVPVRPGWYPNVFGGRATPTHNFGYDCALPEEIDIDGLEIDLGKMMKDRSAAMFADFDPKNENASAPYPYRVTKLLKVKNVTVTDGKRWMFFRNPKLFKDLKVEGACPGYPPR